MTIGFVLHLIYLRNDMRAFFQALAKIHRVVLFVPSDDEKIASHFTMPGIEIRVIRERKRSMQNYVQERAFLLMRKLPASRHNYYLMEESKAEQYPDPVMRKKAQRILRAQRVLPHWISYDQYLNTCRFTEETDISGVDHFVFLTEICDDYLFARLLHLQKKVFVYVYSWDHACKHTRFSKRANYLVWHEGIQQDLMQLQDIPEKAIHIFGSTQFGYLDQYLHAKENTSPYDTPYIFIAGSAGRSAIAREEIEIMEQIAFLLQKEKPTWKLVIRPYPQHADWDMYHAIRSVANVILDDQYRQKDLSTTDADIQKKLCAVDHSEAFLHFGTTLGLEAFFTRSPSFIVDIAKPQKGQVSLYHLVHQYQNEKYILSDPRGVLHDYTDIQALLHALPIPNEDFPGARNRKLFTVRSFDALAHTLSVLIREK